MSSYFTQGIAAQRNAERSREAAAWRLARQTARHAERPDQIRPTRLRRAAALLATGFHRLAARRLVSEHRQTRPLAD